MYWWLIVVTSSPGRRRKMGWSWQERFDKIPQRICKQRGGHTCSRYVADVGEVWRFCYAL